MKKHHATVLIVAGLIVIMLATNFVMNASEPEQKGYVVADQPRIDAVACCTIGEKTCYAFDDDCERCNTICN